MLHTPHVLHALPCEGRMDHTRMGVCKDALNNPKYVEELSGLAEVQRKAEELNLGGDGEDGDDWALSD